MNERSLHDSVSNCVLMISFIAMAYIAGTYKNQVEELQEQVNELQDEAAERGYGSIAYGDFQWNRQHTEQ